MKKMFRFKRHTTLLLLVTTVLVFVLGCTEKPNDKVNNNKKINNSYNSENGLLFDKPVTLSMLIPSQQSVPFREDWYVLDKIKERTNVSFNAAVVPEANYLERVKLTIASDNVADIIYTEASVANRYGQRGAFINTLDYEKDMPNFKKWRLANKSKLLSFTSPEGKMYLFPSNEIGETNRMGWLYREDIFKKHNLQIPKNEEEFLNVTRKLKEIYPETDPFIFRFGVDMFNVIAPSWGADYSYFYDNKSGMWKYGPLEDGFKNMLTFFYKLYNEGIIPKDFATINTKSWTDRISGEKAFLTVDYLNRIDFFNIPLKKEKSNFTMAYMPPWKGGALGQNKTVFTAKNLFGLCAAASSKQLDKVLKYIDWTYSDEAYKLLSWGVDGETYKVEDGRRKFIDAEDVFSLKKNTGLSTVGMYTRFDYDSHVSLYSTELARAVIQDRTYNADHPVNILFTGQDQEVMDNIGQSIEKYKREQITKFITGARSLEEWDKFKQEVKNLGLDKVLEIYNKSYNMLKNTANQ